MKKIFLLLMMIVLAFALPGCIKTTTNYDEDFENVSRILELTYMKRDMITYDFEDEVNRIQDGTHTFYTTRLIDDKSYYYCGYFDPEITETPGWLSYESSKKGTWLRYDKQEDIPTTYGGKKIFFKYKVYIIKVEKDIINNKTYNRKIKYYQDMFDGLLGPGNFRKGNNLLLFYRKNLSLAHFNIHGVQNVFFTNFNYLWTHQLEINEDQSKDIVFDNYQKTYSTITGELEKSTYVFPDEVRQYFKILEPYAREDPTLDENPYSSKYTYVVYTKVRINLDIITALVKGELE